MIVKLLWVLTQQWTLLLEIRLGPKGLLINQFYTGNSFFVFIMTFLLVIGIGSHYLSVFATSSVILFPRNVAHNDLYCEPSKVCSLSMT